MLTAHRFSNEQVTLTLEGTFDSAAAWRVHEALAHLAPVTHVSLDFRGVRAFHDFAIALLAKDILALRGHVDAAGLCKHQRRILKYFGVDEATLGGSPATESQEPRPGLEDVRVGA